MKKLKHYPIVLGQLLFLIGLVRNSIILKTIGFTIIMIHITNLTLAVNVMQID